MTDGAPRSAMVFAAGFGTRMGNLTSSRPKPLLNIGNTTLLDHALDHVTGAGLETAVVNLHYLGQQIREHVKDRDNPRIELSEEQPAILETGGGIAHALPQLGPDAFVTINSDTVFLGANPLDTLLNAWPISGADAVLLLVPVGQTLGYSRSGDFFLDASGGQPIRRGDAPAAPYVYAGAQIIRACAFDDAPEGTFSLNVIWDRLLRQGRLRAVIYPGRWVDVGTPEGLEIAREALAEISS